MRPLLVNLSDLYMRDTGPVLFSNPAPKAENYADNVYCNYSKIDLWDCTNSIDWSKGKRDGILTTTAAQLDYQLA